MKFHFSKNAKEIKELKEINDMKTELCKVEGSWLKNLVIDSKTYWECDKVKPVRQKPLLEGVAPSDWRYREDLLWVKFGDMAVAHEWKVRLEEQQRLDRRNR